MLKVSLFMLLAAAGIVHAQAMVEYGAAAGAAATSTTPAAGIAKTLNGLVDRLQAPAKAAIESTNPSPLKAPPAPTPAPVYEDPGAIRPGIAYDDLIRRFGPPTVAVTDCLTRTLLYSGKAGRVELQVEDGKVISVQPKKPPQHAFMLPG